MSPTLDLALQALGWISVAWLIVVDVMIRTGRLPANSLLFRIAGCAAALSVMAASFAERLWPVLVLGGLWLRTEVFGYRRELRPGSTGPDGPAHDDAAVFVPGFGPLEPAGVRSGGDGDGDEVGAGEPGGAVRIGGHRSREHLPNLPHPHLPHPHLPHLPHPHLNRKTVNVVFRVEMAVLITVASVFFVIWAQQQRDVVGRDANNTLCHWLTQC